MTGGREPQQQLEWRINVPAAAVEGGAGGGGSGTYLVVPDKANMRMWSRMKKELFGRVVNFLDKAWKLGVSDPRKVIHCLKVGMALSLVSLFYYMRPLYQGVGGNAMWAIMTVVVVFEYTVGATLYKSINRATGTFLAGLLGVGVHWVATQAGQRFEPVILGFSVFLLASAATFSRFIPSIKARFDYGAMIFILTFSLVSVSGYRVEKLFELAHHRLTTVAIGTSLCILTSMLVYPVWAGQDLHSLIHRNLDKLASSLQGCASMYFNEDLQWEKAEEQDQDRSKKIQAYKCVLNSKATEESMANFARWEPAHGCFSFRHPWKQYLKIGALMRDCAYCIETLAACSIDLDVQAPDYLKRYLKDACIKVSSHSSDVLKEAALMMRTMTRSYKKLDYSVGEMNFAVQQLQDALISFPAAASGHPSNSLPMTNDDNEKHNNNNIAVLGSEQPPPKASSSTPTTATSSAPPPDLLELLPLLTLVSLLIEISARIEDIADATVDLAELADFKTPSSTASEEKKPVISKLLQPHDNNNNGASCVDTQNQNSQMSTVAAAEIIFQN